MSQETCKCCCDGSGSVPTGHHTRQVESYVFVPDGKSKECPGCDGTGVPVRLHNEEPWKSQLATRS